MLQSFNRVRFNNLCKPLIGKTFHRVDHNLWSHNYNLHWIHFTNVVVNICVCHHHPSYTFSLEGFWVTKLLCYVLFISCYEWTCVVSYFSLHAKLWDECVVNVLWLKFWIANQHPLPLSLLSHCYFQQIYLLHVFLGACIILINLLYWFLDKE